MYLLLDVPFVFVVVGFVVAVSLLLLLTLATPLMFDVVLMPPKLNVGADDAGLLAVNDVNPENPLKAEGAA